MRSNLNSIDFTPGEWEVDQEEYERQRKVVVWKVQRDLYILAINLGQTDAQALAKLDALFSTFAGEWSLYILVGSPAIITAIQNDATLAWLNTLVSGVSIRQRLINRIS
jgi:hypothetical protein